MEKLTYKQAFDMITEAYIKDEIKPYDNEFCFCGTLSHDSNWRWEDYHKEFSYPYTNKEYLRMEYPLLHTLRNKTVGEIEGYSMFLPCFDVDKNVINHPNYENALFEGMCNALDVLKQIHIERGEDVDESLKLPKRELV